MSEINYHVLQKAGLRRYFESLQMVLMGRFCNFSKSKTVKCHMQACVGASRLASDSERLNFITLIIGSQYFSRFTRFALRTTVGTCCRGGLREDFVSGRTKKSSGNPPMEYHRTRPAICTLLPHGFYFLISKQ